MGPGCAFFDYDGDGWLDILLVNGMDWPGHKRQRSALQLYRNNRNGTFTDVTRAAGLNVEMYGMGVAVGGLQQRRLPGYPDHRRGPEPLVSKQRARDNLSTSPRRPRLGGTQRLQHLRRVVRLRSGRLSGSARLQLREMVARARRLLQPRMANANLIARRRLTTGKPAGSSTTAATERLKTSPPRAASSTPPPNPSAWPCIDYDRDGWPDLLVANDTQPNKLYRNLRNGTFEDVAVNAGVAFSAGWQSPRRNGHRCRRFR